MIDLKNTWAAAEDFLRRYAKSKSVRAAEKRRDERRRQVSAQRAKRDGAVAGISAAGTFGYALTVAPLASAAIAAGAVAVGALALVHLVVGAKKPPARFSREELAALPVEAEEWLLERRLELPREAATAFDQLLDHLGELPPHLARLEPGSTPAWEARRLIGEHLPGLVGPWCALPASAREEDSEAKTRLVGGLTTIALELERLTRDVSRDERMALETRQRFLDSRYRDGFPAR
jgi:hypothetical protein